MNQIKVSFVIPHKGREEMLQRTLRSIKNQQAEQIDYEVILVSQNPELSPELNQMLESLPSQLIRRTDGCTISKLRNLGAAQAQGEYLAFLDADVDLSANWLQVMVATLNQRTNTALVSAYQINGVQAPPLEKIRTALSNAEVDCAVSFLPGRNLFLARATFDKVGGFPEHLVTCEDYYFTERVSQLGELFYTSGANYVHIGEDKDYVQMFHKEIWRGQSNLASIKGRRIPPREWLSFVVPPSLILLFAATVIFILRAQWQASFGALILMLIPIAAYSFRLKRLVGSDVSLMATIRFYGLYFPARAIGTFQGAVKMLRSG